MIAVHFHLSLFLTGILLIRWEQSIKQKPSTEQAYDSFQDEHVHKQNLEQFSNFASRTEKNKHISLLSFKYSHNYATIQQTWDVNMYTFTLRSKPAVYHAILHMPGSLFCSHQKQRLPWK